MKQKVIDALITIKNNYERRNKVAYVWKSKFVESVLEQLVNSNFIKGYTTEEVKYKGKLVEKLKIELAYHIRNVPAIRQMKVLSNSTRRLYITAKKLKLLSRTDGSSGTNVYILSTNKGRIMNHIEALENNCGGLAIVQLH